MSSKEVIVLGTTHHNTLGIIRSLGESPYNFGVVLVLYGESESYLTSSKYVKSHYFVKSPNEVTGQLLALAKEEKQVIIATTDEAVHQLDLNAGLLLPYFHFFGTKEVGRLTWFSDKQEQDITAQSIGLNTPTNYTPENICYPCLLKPLASIAGGKRVIICNNKEEYHHAISEFPKTQFQIQQYLPKEQEIVLVGLSVNGEVHIPAYILKQRENAGGGTTYSTVHPSNDLDSSLVEKSKELVKVIGYEGLFGIEYLLCEGKYWFIEINLRSDATSYAVSVAGVNLPVAYVLAKQGEEINNIVNNQVCIIYSMVEFRDFEFVLKRKIGLLSWLRQRNQCKCLYFYSHSDREPYRINRRKLWRRIMSGLTNKI